MSRRFYLPLKRTKHAVPKGTFRFGAVPRWLIVAIPSVIGLLVVWYIAGELGFLSFQPTPEHRTRVGTAIQRESEIKPADSLQRPTVEDNISEAIEQEPITRSQSLDQPIRLQVLNGCGVKGLAKIVSPALRAYGFDVRETRNAGSFRYTHSMVLDRIGSLETALAIADSLGIDPSLVKTEIARNLADIDVTLIVGADYQNLRLNIKN